MSVHFLLGGRVSMPTQFLRYILACAILFPCCIRAVAQDVATAPQPDSNSAAYPESADGLKSLLGDILASIKSGDAQRTSQLLAALSVPSHKEWLLKSFGPAEGPRLEATYLELGSKAPNWLRKRFEVAAKRGQTHVEVKVWQKPIDPSSRLYKAVGDAMITDFPIYDASGGSDFLGDFVYVDGGFRYLDKQIFLALSNAPAMRIRIGGNVQAARRVSTIQPVYPAEAKQDHVEGTVVLHVIIGKDGSVQETSALSGPPALVQAALDAVKQWRYQPTLLNGKPVEVDTQVNVNFQLHP
jgi:TonB family protein